MPSALTRDIKIDSLNMNFATQLQSLRWQMSGWSTTASFVDFPFNNISELADMSMGYILIILRSIE